METTLRDLEQLEIESVSGGIVCGGWCVAAIGATFVAGALAGYTAVSAALD